MVKPITIQMAAGSSQIASATNMARAQAMACRMKIALTRALALRWATGLIPAGSARSAAASRGADPPEVIPVDLARFLGDHHPDEGEEQDDEGDRARSAECRMWGCGHR